MVIPHCLPPLPYEKKGTCHPPLPKPECLGRGAGSQLGPTRTGFEEITAVWSWVSRSDLLVAVNDAVSVCLQSSTAISQILISSTSALGLTCSGCAPLHALLVLLYVLTGHESCPLRRSPGMTFPFLEPHGLTAQFQCKSAVERVPWNLEWIGKQRGRLSAFYLTLSVVHLVSFFSHRRVSKQTSPNRVVLARLAVPFAPGRKAADSGTYFR